MSSYARDLTIEEFDLHHTVFLERPLDPRQLATQLDLQLGPESPWITSHRRPLLVDVRKRLRHVLLRRELNRELPPGRNLPDHAVWRRHRSTDSGAFAPQDDAPYPCLHRARVLTFDSQLCVVPVIHADGKVSRFHQLPEFFVSTVKGVCPRGKNLTQPTDHFFARNKFHCWIEEKLLANPFNRDSTLNKKSDV